MMIITVATRGERLAYLESLDPARGESTHGDAEPEVLRRKSAVVAAAEWGYRFQGTIAMQDDELERLFKELCFPGVALSVEHYSADTVILHWNQTIEGDEWRAASAILTWVGDQWECTWASGWGDLLNVLIAYARGGR